MHAYSQDLPDRIFRALARGERPTAIARRFEVSRVWVHQVRARLPKQGRRSSLPMGGYRQSRLARMAGQLRAWLQAQADLTLAQMCARRAEHGIAIKIPALWHQLNKWGLTFKKTLHANEQERAEVQAARTAWMQSQPALEVTTLVFLDETGARTNMTRTCGRAPGGERCLGSVPHGHWQITTFIAGVRVNALTAPMVLDGPMDGKAFLAYVTRFLCPTLTPGDIVIADNLPSHQVAGVRAAIAAAGASLCYLPPYSPDLNPIEQLFAKLKALLKKAAPRTVDALWHEIGILLDAFSATECRNYFASAGYVST